MLEPPAPSTPTSRCASRPRRTAGPTSPTTRMPPSRASSVGSASACSPGSYQEMSKPGSSSRPSTTTSPASRSARFPRLRVCLPASRPPLRESPPLPCMPVRPLPPHVRPCWTRALLPGRSRRPHRPGRCGRRRGDREEALMRAFTAAAVQIAPVAGPLSPEAVRKNLDKCVDFTRRCVEDTGAELVVLPETATTGFTPDCTTEELWDLVSELPGPVIDPICAVARDLGVHGVGTHERGPRARRGPQQLGAHRPAGRGAGDLPQDAPLLERARRPRRLGDPGGHGGGVRHRPRTARHDHLLRR